jgi:hypothetical protein
MGMHAGKPLIPSAKTRNRKRRRRTQLKHAISAMFRPGIPIVPSSTEQRNDHLSKRCWKTSTCINKYNGGVDTLGRTMHHCLTDILLPAQ